ncbi:MAG: efflux RND transporter periplasmic adaptor subunit [Saprospiraceae bacterium]|jgi:cobalt-zinc-cadmium efflux system membrane fusion protein|nr:efflux RND transporter periplasmic adaptor subunit [Saprospiraceae bacterium]
MYIKYFLIIFAGLFLFSCKSSSNETAELLPEQVSDDIVVYKAQFDGLKMTLGAVSEHTFDQVIAATGKIEVEHNAKATVSSHIGGFVQNMSWKIGQKVNKGALLFTLSSTEAIDIQQKYMESKAQLAYLKSEAERQEILAKENAVANKNAMKANADYKVMMSTYQSLKEKIKLMNMSTKDIENGQFSSTIHIYAPISGYISAIHVNKGGFLATSDIALEIVNADDIHLVLDVFEKDVMNIKTGQKINFTIPETGTQTYQATVFIIGKMIEGEKRTVEIHGHLDKTDTNLLAGMYVEAKIVTDSALKPAINHDALVKVDDKYYVLVMKKQEGENYYFAKKEVKIGPEKSGFVEIENNEIPADAKILTKGAFDVMTE